jgi:hypothetical protein
MFAKILLSVVTLTLAFPIHTNAQCITKSQLLAEIQENRKAHNLPLLIVEPRLPTNFSRSFNVLKSRKVAPTRSIGYRAIVKTVAPGISPNISVDFSLDRYVNVDVKPYGSNCMTVVTYGERFNLAPID